jgi:hypothetical protein
MYNRICEENGPADHFKHCLGNGELLARLWWDLDRAEHWASVAADNLRSYVRDSDPFKYWDEAVSSEFMGAIIRKTESEERKAALYQEAEGC